MKFAAWFLMLASVAAAQTQPASGRWDGSITIDDLKLPFSIDLDLNPDAVSGTFVNGAEKVRSTAGTFKDGILRLTFQQHGTGLEASIVNGRLSGTYGGVDFGRYAVDAGPFCTCAVVGEAGPDISGTWTLHGQTPEISATGRLEIERRGNDTVARILDPEDTNGELTGLFDGLAFLLHHFDGARASRLELEPRPNGTLEGLLKERGRPSKKFYAARATGH
jgi:hypothetical protein